MSLQLREDIQKKLEEFESQKGYIDELLDITLEKIKNAGRLDLYFKMNEHKINVYEELIYNLKHYLND